MKKIVIVGILIAIIYMAGNAVKTEIKEYISNASLIMSGVDKEKLRQIIIAHYNDTILKNKTPISENTEIAIETAYINTDSLLDVIAKIDTAQTCGSGGCIRTLYIQNQENNFYPLSFSYAVKEIKFENSITNGMHDMTINGNEKNQLRWDGSAYTFNEF